MTEKDNKKVIVVGAGNEGLEAAKRVLMCGGEGSVCIIANTEGVKPKLEPIEIPDEQPLFAPETRAERRAKANKKKKRKF